MAAKHPFMVATAIGLLLYGTGCLVFGTAIGREHPEIARFMRPPLFNLAASYKNGLVLGFEVGMDREHVITLAQKGGFEPDPACWGDDRAGGVALYHRDEVRRQMRGHDRWCLRRENTYLDLRFAADRLAEAGVTYITNNYIT